MFDWFALMMTALTANLLPAVLILLIGIVVIKIWSFNAFIIHWRRRRRHLCTRTAEIYIISGRTVECRLVIILGQ